MTLPTSLTVLSLEQATTLPFLTQRLARDGARVIRLEPPGRGDPNRYVGRDVLGEAGMASYFLPNNCGKQAVTLNLGCEAGRALLHQLITRLPVDIFATNNRPSSYARLGIDYETLRALRPDLIWLGITGFGPDSDEAAYDPVLQARAGWMALTGEPDSPPLVFGLPMVDLGAAEHAYGALMKALYRRALTGAGSRVDVSMLHSALTWMASPLMLAALGEPVKRRGNTHQFFAPVSVYPTTDGFAYIAVGNDRQWEALTRLPGFEHLAEPAYQRNAGRIADFERLNSRITERTRGLTFAELSAAFKTIGVPVARVNSLDDVLADPLLRACLTTAHDERSGAIVVLPPVAEVSDRGPARLAFPPRLGEHNEQILSSVLDYRPEDIDGLRQQGVI
jgi:crotonobetainyl-CoA:carnitine CoA-transferase CaiB-like acyl-CoA transferase